MSLVEYHDPDGLFPLISPQLQSHLPLRNLHWKSASRPLRSIDSLHVDFLHDQKETPPKGGKSENDQSKSSYERTRRHQLPGLRSTPYLKIFLLRCDDKDTYKSPTRNAIKDWLAESGAERRTSSKTNKSENHDAFEWLVLHIVLPNTAAASQPRTRGASIGQDKDREKPSGGPKWPQKGTKTIFERLKEDFNKSSKSTIDRIAQIRLSQDVLPSEVLPSKPGVDTSTTQDGSNDKMNDWSDLITRLRTLILTSFNLRVDQYEEDVREKEAQRHLPGWNFCTFYVLKEGLVRAFESVGLIEDALAGYDELSAGLDMHLADQTSTDGQTSNFAPFTEDMSQLLAAVLDGDRKRQQEAAAKVELLKPFKPERKPYRELIVSNNISIFDFRCYTFGRQLQLLLKLASPSTSYQNGGRSDEETLGKNGDPQVDLEDAAPLAEVCQLAGDNIMNLARLLRQDLWSNPSKLSDSKGDNSRAIDAIIATWTFAAVEQILERTASSHFLAQAASLSSMSPNNSGASTLGPRGTASRGSLQSKTLSTSDVTLKDAQWRPSGLANVASHRADLILMQRKILERLPTWRSEHAETIRHASMFPKVTPDANVTNGEMAHNGVDSNEFPISIPEGYNFPLIEAATSKKNARSIFYSLTEFAASSYRVAGRSKAAERLSADLAVLKYNQGDFAAAASIFSKIALEYGNNHWSMMEATFLKMYADCLRVLNRKDEHMRAIMALFSKRIDAGKGWKELASHQTQEHGSTTDTDSIFSELLKYSEQLPYDFTAPMQKYFARYEVDHHIKLLPDRDGFDLGIELQQQLCNELHIDAVKVRLVNSADGQAKDIWLQSDGPIDLDRASSKVSLRSNTTTLGSYFVDKIIVQTSKIAFTYESLVKSEATTPLGLTTSISAQNLRATKGSKMLCYPRPVSFRSSITVAREVHIGSSRALEITFDTGDNETLSSQMILRAGSGGLRLRTANASVLDSSHRSSSIPMNENSSKAGVLDFGAMPRETFARVLVPFDMERLLPAIAVRLEFQYATTKGTFSFQLNSSVKIEVHLDINVQDMFKQQGILSKFMFKPVDSIPLRVLDANLEESETFEVHPGMQLGSRFASFVVLPNEPASMTFKICRRATAAMRWSSKAKWDDEPVAADPKHMLVLRVKYRSLQDEITETVMAFMSKQIDTRPDLQQLRALLMLTLKDKISRNMSLANYESAGLCGRFTLPSFDDLEWLEILDLLPAESADELQDLLEEWHENNATMHLDGIHSSQPSPTEAHTSTLIIPFEIPQLGYLHTATLMPHPPFVTTILPKSSKPQQPNYKTRPPSSSKSNIALLAHPISTTLTLTHTRMHNLSQPLSSPTGSKKDQGKTTFHYSIEPPSSPDFLVTGPTTARFAASEHEISTFSIHLIPLRTGRLELPDVRVWLAEYPTQGIDMEHAAGTPDAGSALGSPISAIAKSPTFGGGGAMGSTSAGFVTSPPIQTSARDSTSNSSAVTTFPGAIPAQDLAAQARTSVGSPTALGLASSPAVSEPPPTPSTAGIPGAMDEGSVPIEKTCRTEMKGKSYVEVVRGVGDVTVGLGFRAEDDEGLEKGAASDHGGYIEEAEGVEMIDVRHWA
ncbi:MAG: hypothetical protein M1831_004940 [Alyxoria varia]|nr:MAG: hypothetical protein M1831_004940 [Alyxoria varia]